MEPTTIEYTSAKAWVALIALIVTSISSTDIVPVTGTWHTAWTIVVIVIGAIATWATPNRVKTIDGEVV